MDMDKSIRQETMKKQYVGLKTVLAWPETKDGKEGYAVQYLDGYQSWSPKEVFEEAYRESTGVSFSIALEAVKRGSRISRYGWNGKNMFVVYQKGYPEGIPCNEQTAEAWDLYPGDLFKCNPYLQIKQMDGSHSMWVPSIGDVLAEDWCILN